jgi:hypothetical protein
MARVRRVAQAAERGDGLAKAAAAPVPEAPPQRPTKERAVFHMVRILGFEVLEVACGAPREGMEVAAAPLDDVCDACFRVRASGEFAAGGGLGRLGPVRLRKSP